MKLNVDKLLIEGISFETRFSNGFLYWDNCGKIFREITVKWPNIEFKTASTERSNLTLKEEFFNIAFSHLDMLITQSYPNNLDFFKEATSFLIPSISNKLEVTLFTRIGIRIQYVYPTTSFDEAKDIFYDFSLFKLPKEKISLFGNKVTDPKLSFKIESEDFGYGFNIIPTSRKANFDGPKLIKYDDSALPKTFLLIDVDCYTLKAVELAILDCSEMIKKAEKKIKTSLSKLLYE